jgi:DNA-binding XRE family transcriptional regulator
MSWNYRIVRYRSCEGFGLHEVFYDDDGLPWGMTESPAKFVSGTDEGPAGIKASLLRARVDAIKRPVFDEPEEDKWPGKPPAHEESRCADETPAQGAPINDLPKSPKELIDFITQLVWSNKESIIEALNVDSRTPAESADLIDGIRFAINQISEHIEEHHDFDYQPDRVPSELSSLRGIQHHLEGCLIKDDGSPVRSQPATENELADDIYAHTELDLTASRQVAGFLLSFSSMHTVSRRAGLSAGTNMSGGITRHDRIIGRAVVRAGPAHACASARRPPAKPDGIVAQHHPAKGRIAAADMGRSHDAERHRDLARAARFLDHREGCGLLQFQVQQRKAAGGAYGSRGCSYLPAWSRGLPMSDTMTEVMHPSGRVARALVNLRTEVMQALADAATMSADTGRYSMRNLIKDEGEKLGLSLQEVANRAGITKSHMWELEQGRAVNPTIWTVYGLSRALGVPFSIMAAGALNDTEDAG